MKRSTGSISTFLLITLALVPLISCSGSSDLSKETWDELSATLDKLIRVNMTLKASKNFNGRKRQQHESAWKYNMEAV